MDVWFDHIVSPDVCKYLIHIFFSLWVFFHSQIKGHSRIKGRQGKGKPITVYHFHPLQEHLGISRAITYSVHVSVDQTLTGNLLLPTALHQPLSHLEPICSYTFQVHCQTSSWSPFLQNVSIYCVIRKVINMLFIYRFNGIALITILNTNQKDLHSKLLAFRWYS